MQREDVFFVIPGAAVPMDETINIWGEEFFPSVDGNKKINVASACTLAFGNVYVDNAHARDDCLMFRG